jgi:hypothetical protein
MNNQNTIRNIGGALSNRDAAEQITPEQFLAEVRACLSNLTTTEATRALEYGRAWATVFYDGRVPAELFSELDQLEAQWLS